MRWLEGFCRNAPWDCFLEEAEGTRRETQRGLVGESLAKALRGELK